MNTFLLFAATLSIIFFPFHLAKRFEMAKPLPKIQVVWAILTGIGLNIITTSIMSYFAKRMHLVSNVSKSVDMKLLSSNLAYVLYIVIILVVVAPIIEESIFRFGGTSLVNFIFKKIFKDSHALARYWAQVIIPAIAFGLFHVNGGAAQMIYAGLNGVILGIVFMGRPGQEDKNLFRSVLVHGGFNFTSTVLLIATAVRMH